MLFVSPVNIAPAVRVPEAVTPQQAASGQTAIMYPSAHAHALGQMVGIIRIIIIKCCHLCEGFEFETNFLWFSISGDSTFELQKKE